MGGCPKRSAGMQRRQTAEGTGNVQYNAGARMYPAIRQKVTLPGHGDPGPGCGETRELYCPQCGYEHTAAHQCQTRGCPSCYTHWAEKEALIMRARCFDMGTRLHHIVISWDEDKTVGKDGELDVAEFRRRRKEVYRILRLSGCDGGVVVFHPFRESEPGRYDRVSPHWHAVVSGRWIADGGTVRSLFRGIVLKRIPGRVDRSLDRFYYLLHHCGIIQNVHGVTWFGSMAYNRGRGSEETECRNAPSRDRVCPRCGIAELEPRWIMDYTSFPAVRVYNAI